MTFTIQTSNSIGTGVRLNLATSGDDLLIVEGVTVSSTNSTGVTGSADGVTLTVDGHLSGGSRAVSTSGEDTVVTIGATGSVYSANSGTSFGGIYMSGEKSNLINYGSVTTPTGTAIMTRAGQSQIENHGVISGKGGVFLGLFDDGPDHTLINGGTINASIHTQAVTTARYNNGVFSEARNTTVINLDDGVITANATHGAGIRIDYEESGSGINSVDGAKVFNYGTVAASQFVAVYFEGEAGAVMRLKNFGTLTGAEGAFRGNEEVDILRNGGLMEGDVLLGRGDDIFDGRGGIVDGTVYGGFGDDTYYVSESDVILMEFMPTISGTELNDTVVARTDWVLGDNFEHLELIGGGDWKGAGNSADNTITGNSGVNELVGNGGADHLKGAGGGDAMDGNGGDDILFGGGGGDTMRGGGAVDAVNGDGGDDILRGGRGDDALNGAADDDILFGGEGRDTLTGGSGSDTFMFTRAGHSTNIAADVILDFEQGLDLIDLSRLPGDLTFITGGFTGSAGEVRITGGGGNAAIRIDIDGDASVDMKIDLTGVSGLGAEDLVL